MSPIIRLGKSGYASRVQRRGQALRRIMRLDEPSLGQILFRRTTGGSSSGRIMHLSPVFILETHKKVNFKLFAKVRPDG